MGFKERLRDTAQQGLDGLAKGQAKLEQYQNRQSVNSQLQALGQGYWLLRSGRATTEQLEGLLVAVRPVIEDAEHRSGQLTWPSVPVGPEAPPAAGPSAPPPPPPASYPAPSAPVESTPVTSASTASAPDLAPSPAGPDAGTAGFPSGAPAESPGAIHLGPESSE